MWSCVLLAFVWLAAPAPAMVDASGRILAQDGTPVRKAQVCEITTGAMERCVDADAQGNYSIARTTHPKLLVRAKGFIATWVDAAPLNDPVKLDPAATLVVTIVDLDTGEAVPHGRVFVDTTSGQRVGNYVPFNKSGVRISTLEPRTVIVRSDAPGYQAGGPAAIDLVGGEARSLKITMKKAAAKH